MDTSLATAIHKENVHIIGGGKATVTMKPDKLKTVKIAGKKRKASANLIRSTHKPVAEASKDVDLKQNSAIKGNKIKKNQMTQGKRHAAVADRTTKKHHILIDEEIKKCCEWPKHILTEIKQHHEWLTETKQRREWDARALFMMTLELFLCESISNLKPPSLDSLIKYVKTLLNFISNYTMRFSLSMEDAYEASSKLSSDNLQEMLCKDFSDVNKVVDDAPFFYSLLCCECSTWPKNILGEILEQELQAYDQLKEWNPVVCHKMEIKDPTKNEMSFVVGQIYYNLAERLFAGGRAFEGLSYAKEALNLRYIDLKKMFKVSCKRHVELANSSTANSKLEYLYLELLGSSINGIWRDTTNLERCILSPWIILNCYLESILQVGILHEATGDGVKAGTFFRLGKSFLILQSLPNFHIAFNCALAKSLEAPVEKQKAHEVHDVFRRCISVLFDGKSCYDANSHNYDLNLFKLMGDNNIGEIFSVERATLLYNMSWFFLKNLHPEDMSNNCCSLSNVQMQDIFSWLLRTFILCREIPTLFQKVSRLASLILLSTVDDLIPPTLYSRESLSKSHWASFFHWFCCELSISFFP